MPKIEDLFVSPYDDPHVSAGEIADYLYSHPQPPTTTMESEVTTPPNATVMEQWALLEIMGHERLAGRISEVVVAGTKMLLIEVPEVEKLQLPGFQRYLNTTSLFSITPVPESVARTVAGNLQKTAVSGIPAYGYTQGQQLEMRMALGLPAPKEPTPPSGWGQHDDNDPSEY